MTDVAIAEVPGRLTDHYDPKKRALFLSSQNFRERSLSAVGVAAHEAGRARVRDITWDRVIDALTESIR